MLRRPGHPRAGRPSVRIAAGAGPCPRDDPGAHRRPPRHPAARPQVADPRRGRRRQGVLGGGRRIRLWCRRRRGKRDAARAREEGARPACPRSSVQGEDEYSFWHVLVRDVAYGQIPEPLGPRSTERLRSGSSESLESVSLTTRSCSPTTTGRRSNSPARLGADTYELERQTRRSLVLAGDVSCGSTLPRPTPITGRLSSSSPAGEPERSSVLARAAEAAWLAGRHSEAEADYAEAIDDLPHAGKLPGGAERPS